MRARGSRVVPKPIAIHPVLEFAFRTVIHRRADSILYATVRVGIEPHANFPLRVNGFDEARMVWYHNANGSTGRIDRSAHRLALFRAAHRHRQAGDGGDAA